MERMKKFNVPTLTSARKRTYDFNCWALYNYETYFDIYIRGFLHKGYNVVRKTKHVREMVISIKKHPYNVIRVGS